MLSSKSLLLIFDIFKFINNDELLYKKALPKFFNLGKYNILKKLLLYKKLGPQHFITLYYNLLYNYSSIITL